MECRPIRWRGRAGCFLANEVVELTHLTGGGQIPEFRFRDLLESNPYWIPGWHSREAKPSCGSSAKARYGPPEVGRLLSVIAGHSLCLGTFGMPSPAEVRAGAVLHGDAGVLPWTSKLIRRPRSAEIRLGVRIPQAGLTFRRTLSLFPGESVVRVSETVSNLLATDQWIQWQQHVALSASFLVPEHSYVALPGRRGITDPGGYEGHELLQKDREFVWPHAPGVDGKACDLQNPFLRSGAGFVAGVELDQQREYGFICAVNRTLAVAFGCVFLRRDFPWVTIWEENRARTSSPWNCAEQARALEFGVSPLPAGREEMIRRGNLFGIPTTVRLSAKAHLCRNYLIFLARLRRNPQSVADVTCSNNAIQLFSPQGTQIANLAAKGVRRMFSQEIAARDRC